MCKGVRAAKREVAVLVNNRNPENRNFRVAGKLYARWGGGGVCMCEKGPPGSRPRAYFDPEVISLKRKTPYFQRCPRIRALD